MAANNPDAIQYKIVNILTMGLDSSFIKPHVRPRCAELRLRDNEQVVWVAVPSGVEFTVTFKGKSPFESKVFNHDNYISGPPVNYKGGDDEFYPYTVKIEGHEIVDPGIIWWD